MNYPIRTIPPHVRPYDDSATHHIPNPNRPRSQWAALVTPPRKFTAEENRAWEEKLEAEAARARQEYADKSSSSDLTFRQRVARFILRDSDRMLRHSTWWLLFIRSIVVLYSAISLGLAGGVFVKTHPAGCRATSSTYLALVINTIAIPYTALLMYDEFTHKPINERPFQVRLAYTMIDVIAISFNAANLGVAFQALTDTEWVCREGTGCAQDLITCRLQKALVAHLFIVQIAWIGALYTAIYRIAGRLQPLY
jgi:hypothetical protein